MPGVIVLTEPDARNQPKQPGAKKLQGMNRREGVLTRHPAITRGVLIGPYDGLFGGVPGFEVARLLLGIARAAAASFRT